VDWIEAAMSSSSYISSKDENYREDWKDEVQEILERHREEVEINQRNQRELERQRRERALNNPGNPNVI